MNQLKIAILVDGAFYLKRIRTIYKNIPGFDQFNSEYATYVLKKIIKVHVKDNYLYRVLYYDCFPYQKKIHHPVSKKVIHFGKSNQAYFRNSFFECLKRQRKFALRLSNLRDSTDWILDPDKLKKILNGSEKLADIQESDLRLDLRQKGVDMKIGLDIAALAYKRYVDRIVLIAGDSDFVPAAKVARREGIDFLLNPLKQKIAADLFEHIDGLNSICPNLKEFSAKMLHENRKKKD